MVLEYNLDGDLGLNLGPVGWPHISSPTQVGSGITWSAIAAYTNSLALKTDGTLWSWGLNVDGQLGINSTVSQFSPIQVGSLTTLEDLMTLTKCSSVHLT